MDKGGALSTKSGLITRENGYFNSANGLHEKDCIFIFLIENN